MAACQKVSCLGAEWCEEWQTCENDPSMPQSKKAKVAEPAPPDRSKLSLKKSRFAKPLAEVDMNSFCKQVVPDNTKKQTDWSVRVFESWRNERVGEKCPADLLEQCTAEKLNFWLCHFVVEARRSDGKPYPSATLYQLLTHRINSELISLTFSDVDHQYNLCLECYIHVVFYTYHSLTFFFLLLYMVYDTPFSYFNRQHNFTQQLQLL